MVSKLKETKKSLIDYGIWDGVNLAGKTDSSNVICASFGIFRKLNICMYFIPVGHMFGKSDIREKIL